MFLHPKSSHSSPEIFQFSTRNFPMTTTKITLQAILKRTFPLKFSDDFFSHYRYLPKKFLSTQPFGKCSGLRDFYTFLLFISKRSRKVPVRHDLLYDTAILTYKIYNYTFLIFISQYAVPASNGQKGPENRW